MCLLSHEKPVTHRKYINNILSNTLNFRTLYKSVFTFKASLVSICISLVPCCFLKRLKRDSVHYRNLKLYKNGVKRYYKELDIINILKALRFTKYDKEDLNGEKTPSFDATAERSGPFRAFRRYRRERLCGEYLQFEP